MRYRIVESDQGKEIIIDDDTKKLQIYYGGNLDLNWQIIDKTADGLINTASITIKEDLQSFYQELQQLFNKLERVKISLRYGTYLYCLLIINCHNDRCL